MKYTTTTLLILLCFCGHVVFAQADSARRSAAMSDSAAPAPKKPRPMSWKDVPSWKFINPAKVALSPDGKWLAWPLLTTEGKGDLIIKSTKDTVTRKYPVGGVNQAAFAFSEDGEWI